MAKVTIKNMGTNPRVFFTANQVPFTVNPGEEVEQDMSNNDLELLNQLVEKGDKLDVSGSKSREAAAPAKK